MWKIFFLFLFIQATITLLINLYKTTSIKYNLEQNVTIFSSIAHGFLNILTAEPVNDLNDIHYKKPKLALQASKAMTHMTDKPLEDFFDNQTNSINDWYHFPSTFLYKTSE